MNIDYKKLFENIKKQCSCPVFLAANKKTFTNCPNSYLAKGFDSKGGFSVFNGFPEINIDVLNNKITPCAVIVLIHEKSHLAHYEKNCECMKYGNDALSEYHAIKDTLIECLKIGDIVLMKILIKYVLFLLDSQDDDNIADFYPIAVKKLIKEKLWKKALLFVGTGGP